MLSRKMKRSSERMNKEKEPWLTSQKALVISTVITALVELFKHFWK